MALSIKENQLLAPLTRFGIGGPADFFVKVENTDQLQEALEYAQENSLEYFVIGEGTNLLVSDEGFRGLVIQIAISFIEWTNANHMVKVGAGNNLMDLISQTADKGWAGMENMYGIPGNLGAAIYGNVGAYGTEIKDSVYSVSVLKKDKIVEMTKEECEFSYRTSVFKKHKDWFVLAVTLRLSAGDKKILKDKTQEIIGMRLKKYPEGLKCPGSYFKNIELAKLNLNQTAAVAIFADKVKGGKLASGVLLEAAGAKGQASGDAKVADYHGNLIYNHKNASARDVIKLANYLKMEVYSKFGIELEEEVQFLGKIN
jgi:UDP-N-acetylmuramate dehydrogenase